MQSLLFAWYLHIFIINTNVLFCLNYTCTSNHMCTVYWWISKVCPRLTFLALFLLVFLTHICQCKQPEIIIMPKLNDFFYKYNYAFPHYILEENHRNENALLTCIYNGKSDIFYPFRNSKDSLNNISTLSSRAFHVICFSKSQ